MTITTSALPNDIEALKAMVLEHAAMVVERETKLAALQDRLSSREQEIEHLKLLIAKLQRMQFGRKSEKLQRQIEQLELRLEDLQADEGVATCHRVQDCARATQAQTTQAVAGASGARRACSSAGRGRLPSMWQCA